MWSQRYAPISIPKEPREREQQSATSYAKQDSQALTELRMNDGIIISQADKGNVTVVMNAAAYEEKAIRQIQPAP